MFLVPNVPSTWQYFRSFYYPSTYLSPIDLEQDLKHHLCPRKDIIEKTQQITAYQGVQRVLSEPLSFDPREARARNQVLILQGFQLLSRKYLAELGEEPQETPFYNVCSHLYLPGWIFKAAGYRVPQDEWIAGVINSHNEMCRFTAFDSLLRFKMNQRIRQAATDLGIDLVVPEEYAVPYAKVGDGDVSRRFFVISKKLDLESEAQTVARIARMKQPQQIAFAHKVSRLIKKIGFADASFDNIRFTKQGRLAFIDTEPAGLFVATDDPLYKKSHSVEKCARIGLLSFIMSATKKG